MVSPSLSTNVDVSAASAIRLPHHPLIHVNFLTAYLFQCFGLPRHKNQSLQKLLSQHPTCLIFGTICLDIGTVIAADIGGIA